MKRVLFLALFVLVSLSVFSQRKDAVVTNTESGRFEFIQSKLMRSLSFKLDKYTGDIYLFEDGASENASFWLPVKRQPTDLDVQIEGQINYQLYMGAYAVRDCFLLNLNTGVMWFFYQKENGEYTFELLE